MKTTLSLFLLTLSSISSAAELFVHDSIAMRLGRENDHFVSTLAENAIFGSVFYSAETLRSDGTGHCELRFEVDAETLERLENRMVARHRARYGATPPRRRMAVRTQLTSGAYREIAQDQFAFCTTDSGNLRPCLSGEDHRGRMALQHCSPGTDFYTLLRRDEALFRSGYATYDRW